MTFLDRVLAGEWGESPSEETLRAMWQAFWFDTAAQHKNGLMPLLARLSGFAQWEVLWIENAHPLLPITDARRAARKVQEERDELRREVAKCRQVILDAAATFSCEWPWDGESESSPRVVEHNRVLRAIHDIAKELCK